jgi:hypothetical protein
MPKNDFLPNYTGPYISNGEFQTSVEFGSVEPKDQLDALSRLHDSAYAKWPDRKHRTAADLIYKQEADKLLGLYPELAGLAVTYGNWTERSASNIASSVATYGPLGILIGGVQNMLDLNDVLNIDGTKKEVRDYYATDPMPNLQSVNPHGGVAIPGGFKDTLRGNMTSVSEPIGQTISVANPTLKPVIDVYEPGVEGRETTFSRAGMAVHAVYESKPNTDAAASRSNDVVYPSLSGETGANLNDRLFLSQNKRRKRRRRRF